MEAACRRLSLEPGFPSGRKTPTAATEIATVFLFSQGGGKTGVYAEQAMADILRLSDLVKRLLTAPKEI
jgi:hypothetical protein